MISWALVESLGLGSWLSILLLFHLMTNDELFFQGGVGM